MSSRSDSPHARLNALLDEFGARLRVAVQVQCGRQSGLDPDDVEQEVRIRLWQAVERDRNAPFGASYIQKVVLSTVVDAFRRAQVRAAEPLPELETEPALVALDRPDRAAVDAERVDRVMQALDTLAARRRLPVQLHLQGYGLVEIARLTGSSDEAVRKLVSRGLEELKVQLANFDLGELDD